jgi:hypothetical protein
VIPLAQQDSVFQLWRTQGGRPREMRCVFLVHEVVGRAEARDFTADASIADLASQWIGQSP